MTVRWTVRTASGPSRSETVPSECEAERVFMNRRPLRLSPAAKSTSPKGGGKAETYSMPPIRHPPNKKSHAGNRRCGLFFLVSQASAALSSSASQHLAAVGGSHSLAETVLHLAMTLLGLISTEHSVLPLSKLSGVVGRENTRPQPNTVILYRTYPQKSRNFCIKTRKIRGIFALLWTIFPPTTRCCGKVRGRCGNPSAQKRYRPLSFVALAEKMVQ